MNDIEGQQTLPSAPSAPLESPPQATYADPIAQTSVSVQQYNPPYPALPQREHIIYVQPVQVQPIHQAVNPAQPQNEMGIAPALYCASCAVFFLPFGWIIGVLAACWFQRLNRPRTISEVKAYKFLNICLIVNLIFTILFLIFV